MIILLRSQCKKSKFLEFKKKYGKGNNEMNFQFEKSILPNFGSIEYNNLLSF